jgi:photosystem II stability/assembly factor-like uncharacterized protein
MVSGISGRGYSSNRNGVDNWIRRDAQDIMGNGYVWSLNASNSRVVLFTSTADDTCLRKTEDDGQTWQVITPHIGAEFFCGNFVFVNNHMIMSTGGGIFISQDFGVTWSQKTIADGLHSNSLYNIVYDGQKIWTSSSVGSAISFSVDLGQTWQQVNLGGVYGIYKLAAKDGIVSIYTKVSDKPTLLVSVDHGLSFKEVPLGQ